MQLIPEEEASKRQDFYDEHHIGWVARPKHNPRPKKASADFDVSTEFLRRGRFKKASNMNYGLNISCIVEDKLALIQRPSDWTQADEAQAYDRCLKEALEENGRAWADGNIRIGDYILLSKWFPAPDFPSSTESL